MSKEQPTFNVVWASSARDDLASIIEYIAKDNPQNAKAVLRQIQTQAEKLNYWPQKNRIVPELLAFGVKQYQETITSPWRIIYRTVKSTVFVVLVVDSRRNVEDILFERLVN